MLDRIRIVLVNTYHPGNVGAAARAMKTMGISHLTLVNPRDFPHPEATALAAGAQDVLENAEVCTTLEEAIQDSTIVIGTSARNRSMQWPQESVRDLSSHLASHHLQENIAFVFGPETMGLSNEQLQQCHFHLYIPGNPDYSVLNLAQAVQICCHEVFTAYQLSDKGSDPLTVEPEYPRKEELSQYFEHLESTLSRVGFLIQKHPGLAMTRLRRLFTRARPDKTELNMLRGILARIDERLSMTPKCSATQPQTFEGTPHDRSEP